MTWRARLRRLVGLLVILLAVIVSVVLVWALIKWVVAPVVGNVFAWSNGPGGPTNVRFSITPNPVTKQNTTLTLRWSADDAETCTIEDVIDDTVCNGQLEVPAPTDGAWQTYHLIAKSRWGRADKRVLVRFPVNNNPPGGQQPVSPPPQGGNRGGAPGVAPGGGPIGSGPTSRLDSFRIDPGQTSLPLPPGVWTCVIPDGWVTEGGSTTQLNPGPARTTHIREFNQPANQSVYWLRSNDAQIYCESGQHRDEWCRQFSCLAD